MSDAVDRLLPGLRVGERVTLVVRMPDGDADVLGFVTALDEAAVSVIDRRGRTVTFGRDDVVIGRRMPVALGRNPLKTPPALLRGVAERAGVLDGPAGHSETDPSSGASPASHAHISSPDTGSTAIPPPSEPQFLVARISALLAGQPFPAEVPEWGESAEFAGVRAVVDNEWVVLRDASVDVARDAAWWATRQGARSVLVVTDDDPGLTDALLASGFDRFALPQSD